MFLKFLFRRKSSNCKDGKKLIKDKVYFPGYVMIEAKLVRYHIIKGITSVIGFLGETKAVSQFFETSKVE
jgi:transcription antitermination factor NusG